jgi:hypothetical protein
MAKVPSGSSASTFSASGNVWFKIFEITPITDGGTSITFPDYNAAEITFPLPKNLPNGQYLLRIEQIALHVGSFFPYYPLSCDTERESSGL